MPFSDYRPDLMGSARLEPTGSFEAGSMQSFTLVYTAGAFGIDDTGSIKIGFRFATDFGPVQFDDPKGPGYTTVEASNGATLEAKWEFKRNIRPWSRSLYIGVVKDFLRPGDTITVRFGDRRFGSPGIRLQTYCESAFEFRVFVDPIATYDYVPLPDSPKIAIVPGPAVTWHALLPTMVRAGESFRLAVKANDAWGNTSNQLSGRLRLAPSRPVVGLPETITCEPGAFAAVVEKLRIDEPGDLVTSVQDESGRELCRSNPLRIVDGQAPWVHFWGDTHGQSNETLGTNSAREHFLFGRDKAFLDVISHQGNDFQITQGFWRELNKLTAEFDEPGRFVCIPGYEWSANTAVGGDRNVHYRHEGETIHRSSHAQLTDAAEMASEANDAHNAHQLFDKLSGKDCVVLAHVGGRYADIKQAHDGRLETSVEVHSAWGTFEWLLRDAFERNYRIGVVCNSDGHKGRPGADFPGASFFGATGGLTCYLAPRLDRDAIFEALRRRRHYGTTGNRMLLSVEAHLPSSGILYLRDPAAFEAPETLEVDRVIMGDIAAVRGDEVVLEVEVVGSAPIERIDVFDGFDLIDTVRPYGLSELGPRIRVIWEGAEYRGRARTTVWDGLLTVAENQIIRAAVINNWNLDRGIQSQDERQITWKAVTTGNFGGLDIWLADPAAGQIKVETRHVRREIPVGEIGLEDIVAEAGGLERRMRFYRLPATMKETRVTLRKRVKLRQTGDTRLYVRVTQEDGHRAWSSPIYLFRQ